MDSDSYVRSLTDEQLFDYWQSILQVESCGQAAACFAELTRRYEKLLTKSNPMIEMRVEALKTIRRNVPWYCGEAMRELDFLAGELGIYEEWKRGQK